MRKRYDFVFALGASCGCTQVLRRAGLQFATMPLDWVGEGGLERRVDFICNGFRDFLVLEDLRSSDLSEWGTQPTADARVESAKTGVRFFHDFITGSTLAAQFPAVRQKYVRRIARFYDCLNAARRICAVWMMTPIDAEIEEARYVRAQRRLAERFPHATVDLLCFVLLPGVRIRDRVTRQVAESVFMTGFDYKTYANPMFPNSIEEATLAHFMRRHFSAVDYRSSEQRKSAERKRKADRYRKYGARGFWDLQLKRCMRHLMKVFVR